MWAKAHKVMMEQTIRMDNEAMIARQKVAVEQQQKLLEGNCENIVKLDEAYGARCKALRFEQGVLCDFPTFCHHLTMHLPFCRGPCPPVSFRRPPPP